MDKNDDDYYDKDPFFGNLYSTSAVGEYGVYEFYRLLKEEIKTFRIDYIHGIAIQLGIEEGRVWNLVDTKVVYSISRRVNGNNVEGCRYYAKVGDEWKMIYTESFGEPELSQGVIGPFDSEEDLLSKADLFCNSIDDIDPEYEYEGDNGPVWDTF